VKQKWSGIERIHAARLSYLMELLQLKQENDGKPEKGVFLWDFLLSVLKNRPTQSVI
jgi:hypothetical protein